MKICPLRYICCTIVLQTPPPLPHVYSHAVQKIPRKIETNPRLGELFGWIFYYELDCSQCEATEIKLYFEFVGNCITKCSAVCKQASFPIPIASTLYSCTLHRIIGR